MKKILNIKGFLFFSILFLGISCQKEYKKEYNWSYPLSGDWTVNIKAGDEVLGSYFIKTYNTSFGQDSIWVDDNGNFWTFKAKAKVDITNKTFETTKFVSYAGNANLEDLVTIANAKVVNKDSIYFEVSFENDPDQLTYIISGHRRLSYEEYNGQIE